MWEQQVYSLDMKQHHVLSQISHYGLRLTACACLMKSRMSSLRAWWILAGPLSSHRHTAWTSLWRQRGQTVDNIFLTDLPEPVFPSTSVPS